MIIGLTNKQMEKRRNIIIDETYKIDMFKDFAVDYKFCRQWMKIVNEALEEKEMVLLKVDLYEKNIIASIGLDRYELPLNQVMREFDKNYIMNEMCEVLKDDYCIKAEYIKIQMDKNTGKPVNALPF